MPELEGFMVFLSGPSQRNTFLRLKPRDVYSGKGFIEEYKRLMEEIDREWVEKALAGELAGFIPQRVRRKKQWVRPKIHAVLEHKGRGRDTELRIIVHHCPPVIWEYVHSMKKRVLKWLYRNAIIINRYPSNIIVLLRPLLPELASLVAKANRHIGYANLFYHEFYTTTRDLFLEAMKKHHIEGELPQEPRLSYKEITVWAIPFTTNTMTVLYGDDNTRKLVEETRRELEKKLREKLMAVLRKTIEYAYSRNTNGRSKVVKRILEKARLLIEETGLGREYKGLYQKTLEILENKPETLEEALRQLMSRM